MRTPKAISDQQQESLRNLLGQTKTKADFQRVQCLWLRAASNMNPVDTARAVGWRQSTVKIIQSRYLREGKKVLMGKGRGGKRYSNLTINQEKELLDFFLEKAKSGVVLVVSEIKIAYEKLFDKKVPKSTITGCCLDMAGVRSPLVRSIRVLTLPLRRNLKKTPCPRPRRSKMPGSAR